MTHTTSWPPGVDARGHESQVLALIDQEAEFLESRRSAIESEARLPDDVVECLHRIGVMRVLLPRPHGHGLDLLGYFRVVERLSLIDGSLGWLAFVGPESLRAAQQCGDRFREELLADPMTFLAGSLMPLRARAQRVEGGYRVTGRWTYASGSANASMLMGNAVIYDGDELYIDGDGRANTFLAIFPRSVAQVDNTWQVVGLRGTSSHDFSVTDLFVPATHGVLGAESATFGAPPAVALGLAQRMIDEFTCFAIAKLPLRGRGATLAEQQTTQDMLARSTAKLRAARLLLHDVVIRAGSAPDTMPTSGELRVEFSLAASHAAQTAVDIVDDLYRLAGASAVYDSCVLQQLWRDIHAAVAHVVVQPINFAAAGRVALGLEQPPSGGSVAAVLGQLQRSIGGAA